MRALTVTAGKTNSLDLKNVGPPPVCDVSANRDHYQTAAKVLARADQDRLSRLITRRHTAAALVRSATSQWWRHQSRHQLCRL